MRLTTEELREAEEELRRKLKEWDRVPEHVRASLIESMAVEMKRRRYEERARRVIEEMGLSLAAIERVEERARRLAEEKKRVEGEIRRLELEVEWSGGDEGLRERRRVLGLRSATLAEALELYHDSLLGLRAALGDLIRAIAKEMMLEEL
jgi:acyl-CoA reductase-like NAD-dependent aldehyde dehydrogenase